MYRSMLAEGKPYPEYYAAPESIRLTLYSTIEKEGFIKFIAQEQDRVGRLFSLQKLMILRYLYDHRKIKLETASVIIQESKDSAQKELEQLRDQGLIEPSGREYMLTAKVYEAVKTDVAYIVDRTVTQIKATERILDYLEKKKRSHQLLYNSYAVLTKIKHIVFYLKCAMKMSLLESGRGAVQNIYIQKSDDYFAFYSHLFRARIKYSRAKYPVFSK